MRLRRVAGVVFAGFLLGWGFGMLEVIWRVKHATFLTRLFQVSVILLVIHSLQYGLGPTVAGVALGLQGVFGATVAGALAGVFPGMLLGTFVGFIRQGPITRAPTARPEGQIGLLAKGVILPAVLLSCVAWIYITYMPRLAEFVAR